MTETTERRPAPRKPGHVLHAAARYDLTVWLFTLGRERVFREKIVSLADLKAGEAVLDVGCGTGSLAIEAKRRVGPSGAVYGIDPSPEMLARAAKMAAKASLEVSFKNGAAQSLPFADGQFDAVLSTLMLHHLPRKAREQFAGEMRRVLKPGGRALVVDFAGPADHGDGLLAHFHRHGHVKSAEIFALLGAAGLTVVDSGSVGFKNLHFVRASVPARQPSSGAES
jgi:ubiquinone/menaquinone biosynthesis C-methylase UbiE